MFPFVPFGEGHVHAEVGRQLAEILNYYNFNKVWQDFYGYCHILSLVSVIPEQKTPDFVPFLSAQDL